MTTAVVRKKSDMTEAKREGKEKERIGE